MKIIFDLDYTLLDTGRFKKKLAEIFIKEDFQADYKKYFKDEGVNFDFEKYLTILKGQGRLDGRREKELRLNLAELLARLDNYLFKETGRVLKDLKAGGAELILLTFGDKKWQEIKANNLSVSRYFNKIIFEEKAKAGGEYLKSLKNAGAEVLIVNDNAEETKAIVKIIGRKTRVFLINGPYAENIKHHWPINNIGKLKYDHK